MHKSLHRAVITAGLTTLGLPVIARANEISFHFQTNGTTMNSASTAGVVPQNGGTWNVLNVSSVSYGTFSQGGSSNFQHTFIDSTGATISALTVSYGGTSAWFTSGTDPATDFGGSAADKGLFTGFLGVNNATNSSNSEATVSISGIPYSSYNVYVYFGSNQASAATFEAIDASVGGSGLTFYNTGNISTQTTTYVAVTSTISTAPSSGDYAIFPENGASTGGTNVFAFSFLNGYVNAEYSFGMEIVDTSTPEPASAALIGVAALGLLRRRRRQCRHER